MNSFENMLNNDNNRTNDKEKKKKMLLTGIIICVILIVLSIFMIFYYKNKDAKTFKLFIDDQQVACSADFYVLDENGNGYVKAKEIANLIGWNYQNGEYGSYTENLDSGYIQNGYEISSFVANSKKLKKYIQVTNTENANPDIPVFTAKSENGTLESSTISLPVLSINNQIYFPLKHLNDICDVSVNFPSASRMFIYSQNYLINLASQKAIEYGYSSLSGVYENIRALAYGMMIVNRNNAYGVINIYTGEQILGLKYTDITFAQNVKEFFVKAIDNSGDETVGIVSDTGKIIISPKSYENISILSDELGLYLVENNKKYGVLDRQGEIIIHDEYDSIGLPESIITGYDFPADASKYLLFNNTIVVEKSGKYGLYNLEGDLTLDTSYYGFGYNASLDSEAAKNSDSLITIELNDVELSNGDKKDVQAIVVQYERDGIIRYGIYDAISEKLIIPCGCERIYKTISLGETKYLLEFQGEIIDLIEYFYQHPEIF